MPRYVIPVRLEERLLDLTLLEPVLVSRLLVLITLRDTFSVFLKSDLSIGGNSALRIITYVHEGRGILLL